MDLVDVDDLKLTSRKNNNSIKPFVPKRKLIKWKLCHIDLSRSIYYWKNVGDNLLYSWYHSNCTKKNRKFVRFETSKFVFSMFLMSSFSPKFQPIKKLNKSFCVHKNMEYLL